jgi:integrase
MSMLQGMLGRAVAWNRLRTSPAPAAKKPAVPRQRAIQPLAPITIEKLRRQLLDDRRDGPRDAMLVSLLAYSGERPEEALALEWRHVRANTLLIEQKLVRGQIVGGQKTDRSIRTISCSDLWLRTSPTTEPRTAAPACCSRSPAVGRGLTTTSATGASGASDRRLRRSGSSRPGRTTCATVSPHS